MTFRFLRTPAAFVFGTLLLTGWLPGQVQQNAPASPYGGSVVEDIVARVNNQIITQSDYDRAQSEMDQDMRSHSATMQQMSEAHRDLLRNLVDQQLWLSKGKELGVTGDTELVKRLDEIRKQYNLESIDDLEKAAREQGVSFEDFKQNIRNQIITQEVMRQEVGQHIIFTPGEVQRYYEAHKQDYSLPESVRLGEILISADSSDPAKVQAAKAKADDIEARLHSGGDFSQLARTFSDGSTAASGGELGVYKKGQLGSTLEDKTFPLKTGEYTDPILTKQGYIILKVVQHTAGGPAPYKDVQEPVEEALYTERMEPAIHDYMTKLRNEAAIFIKPGYTDSDATEAELHPSITFSAYVPPAPKKKSKIERTRFRESTHTFRQKGGVAPAPPEPAAASPEANAPQGAVGATAEGTNTTAANTASPSAEGGSTPTTTTATTATPTTASPAVTDKKPKKNKEEAASQKPGKKEKIRYGQAPRETLPTAANTSTTENAGALPQTADNSQQPANPLEPSRPVVKSRFSARARTEHKQKKPAFGSQTDSMAPAQPNAAEVADQQTQSAPLGLGGNTTPTGKKQKKTATTISEKTRLAQKKKEESNTPPPQPTPVPPVPGAPAPTEAPQPQTPQPAPQTQQPEPQTPQPQSQPQQ
jgi:peptidyl-prolyl cis-trans isomerase SurA